VASAFPADYFEYYAGWVDKIEGAVIPVYPGRQLDYTLPEPYGVIGVIIPWNAPLFSIGMKVAPALAAGNCVVVKPPELAPFTAIRFAELCLEAGFPPGVINVVVGGPEAGDALVGHRGVGKVSFTGSAPTARAVVARSIETLKPVVLELGGKSANIVFADADLDYAAAIAAQVPITTMSGQGCNLPTRLIVEAPVYDEMVARVTAIAATFKVGDPLAPDTMMGPVINEAACRRIEGIISDSVAAGSGRLVTGGHRLGGDLAGGFFLEPTVFADVDPGSPLAQQEIFGPVLSIIRAADEDDAVRLANDTDYGLAAYVWTRDLTRGHRVARRVEAGYVGINGYPLLPPNAPFGGKKGSGYGREGGRAGLEEFISVKNVYVEMEPPFGA
jgi:acyl-CoA reductase-like NAD-dependent aldehyde dehydrogenase